jgi:beta-aspartyl-dipeptidase (metallo-type)
MVSDMPVTLLTGGAIYAPDPIGKQSILLIGEQIAAIGEMTANEVHAIFPQCQIVAADGCVLLPAIIDPHEHLIGAGGEEGFATRLPPVPLRELLLAGIGTVVGCLGTDTVTRHLDDLLGRVMQLRALGMNAYMHTGGFPVPPPTLTGSIERDMVLVEPVIGVGEIAIADPRSLEPTAEGLAKIASAAALGGRFTGKAGVMHVHVGMGEERLALLRAVLDCHHIPPEVVYPTHCSRDEVLLAEAVALAQRGVPIDCDTTEEDADRWLPRYHEMGGPMERLTLSSDAHTASGTPAKLFGQLVACLRLKNMAWETIIACFTQNVARVLKLANTGVLRPGMQGDILVLERVDLRMRHLFVRGKHLVKDGEPQANDAQPQS